MRKGFTLIEIIIYLGIIGTVIVAFVTFSLSISGSRNKVYVASESQANSRVAMNLISQKIRLADDVIAPIENATSTSLELDMPSPDPNIVFKVWNNNLVLVETGVATTTLTSDKITVTNLIFTNWAESGERDNIGLEMTVEYNNPSGDKEFEYSQNIRTSVSIRK